MINIDSQQKNKKNARILIISLDKIIHRNPKFFHDHNKLSYTGTPNYITSKRIHIIFNKHNISLTFKGIFEYQTRNKQTFSIRFN